MKSLFDEILKALHVELEAIDIMKIDFFHVGKS